jgi:hypothetical protein
MIDGAWIFHERLAREPLGAPGIASLHCRERGGDAAGGRYFRYLSNHATTRSR